MPCEMCGAQGDTFKANIEGAELVVCQGCAKYGKIISRVRAPVKEKKSERIQARQEIATKPLEKLRGEIIQVIADDFSDKIKTGREKLGLKQKELALKLAEKESLIQNIESGKFIPSINLARKFERFLKIKLVERHEEEHNNKYKASKVAITIGDMLSIKK
jgi:putative transcription factor